MERFPDEVPSYRNLIEEIAERSGQDGKMKLSLKWKAKLQDLEGKGK